MGMGEKKRRKKEKGEKVNFSLKLGQDGVFTLQKCAQSISRIKLPPIGSFLRKNFFLPNGRKIQTPSREGA